MKRILALLACAAMLLAALPTAFAVNEDIEGKIVIYTSMYPNVVDAMKAELKKEFPNLEIDFYPRGTGEIINQISAEMGPDHSGILSCDLLLVAEPSYSLELKDYGYLHAFDAPGKDNLRFPYDKDGYWYPVRVPNMVLAYNPEKFSLDQMPKTFKAFAEDPALKGWISMGDPLTSGTAFAAVSALTTKYGYEYLDALRANQVMTESGTSALSKLESGECRVVMILEESVLQRRHDDGSKLAVIYPEDGNVLIPSTAMIIREEKSANVNIEACEAVVNWLLSEAGQRCVVNGFMHSVLKDFPDAPYDSIATDKLIESDMGVNWEHTYHDRQAIIDEWNRRVSK